MSLQRKDQKSIPNETIQSKTNPLIEINSNFITQKENENKPFPNNERKTISNNSTLKETNSTNILNSKDLEIFNNLANKLINSSSKPNFKKTNRVQKITASGEKANLLVDFKNIENEIYDKINNFSLKHSSELYIMKSKDDLANEKSARKNMLDSSCLLRKKIKKNNFNDSNKNTPNKNKTKHSNNNKNNNKSFSAIKEKNNKNNINVNPENNFTLNLTKSLTNLNNKNNNNNNNNINNSNHNSFNERINSSLNNSPFMSKRMKSALNASGVSLQLNKDYSDFSLKSNFIKENSNFNKPQKISAIFPENYENCDISASEEKENFALDAAADLNNKIKNNCKALIMNRSIIMKPKPGMFFKSSEKIEFEVEMEEEANSKNEKLFISSSGVTNKDGFAEERNLAFEAQKANQNVNEVFKNFKNNNSEFDFYAKQNKRKIQNNFGDKTFKENAYTRKKTDTAAAVPATLRNSMEQSYDRSSFKDLMQSKSQIANRRNKYASLDLSQLSYDLVKEYSHLQIEKEEEFMKRMLFDIFKRQTKDQRLKKIIAKSKPKLNEKEKIKAFNRLIEDTNRRLEAQEKLNDLKENIFQTSKEKRNISDKDWEEIYKNKYLVYKDNKENLIREKQIEKERIEKENEEQIIKSCKSSKKPKQNVEEFCNKMYYEAKRRQLKNLRNKEIYENQRLKEELETKHAWKKTIKSSLNFSLEINDKELQQFKSRSKSKEKIKKDYLKTNKNIKKSADKLSKTEINNMRFASKLGKDNYLQNSMRKSSSVVLNISKDEKGQKDFGVYEKSPNKVADYTSNLFSANIKNIIDIKNNLFDISDEEIIQKVPLPYKYRAKKPSFKMVPVSFSNTKMKFLPDHIAFNVVDNILNPKFLD